MCTCTSSLSVVDFYFWNFGDTANTLANIHRFSPRDMEFVINVTERGCSVSRHPTLFEEITVSSDA